MKLFILLVGVSITIHTYSMDTDSDSDQEIHEREKKIRISIPSITSDPSITPTDTKPAPLKKIKTMEQLQQIRTSNPTIKKTCGDETSVSISPTVAATVMHTLTYKQDPSENAQTVRALTSTIKKLKKEDPNTHQKLMEGVLRVNNALDGQISAQGIQEYKERKRSASTPTSTSTTESPKRVVKSLLEKQATLQRELGEQEENLKEVKKMMRELTLQAAEHAAEDAALKEQKKGNRIAIAGVLGGVFIGIISSVVTYYTSNCTAHSSTCPNSTGH